jgi:hypothetical protein
MTLDTAFCAAMLLDAGCNCFGVLASVWETGEGRDERTLAGLDYEL